MIRQKLFILFITAILFSGMACSSSKWVVENQHETDLNDFELLSTVPFLERVGTTSPTSPIVNFNLKSSNTYEYVQRVRTDRYIQRYKPSLRSLLFGLAGASIATTAALTTDVSKTSEQILYGTAGFVTLASFLNMKASGDPTPTGESRLLRRTGKVQQTDTVSTRPLNGVVPSYTIYYNREAVVLRNEIPYLNSTYTINLIEELNPEAFEYDSSESIVLEVYFNDETYLERIPLTSIFERFVVVSSEVTALRDEPVLNSRNILTDLAEGSQMKLVSEDSLWYKVLYGISETWISKSDAYPIWRPSEFASQLSIITVPNIPFGNIDVESNIPTLTSRNDSTFALIIENGDYLGNLSERVYSERDGRLIDEYFLNALSIPNNNIIKASDIETNQQLVLAYNRLADKLRRDQKRLIVYLSGYVRADDNGNALLIGTNGNEEIELNSFFTGVSRLPVEELIVFADFDFISGSEENVLTKKLGDQIVDSNSKSSVIFASSESQRSGSYSSSNGEQKRHSIFTYFIAEALKNGETNISGILNYLQRNVDYTSRRLHNAPQNVIYFGNADLSLID